MKRRDYISGFTLMELVTTIAIAAILATIAIPSFRYIGTTNRISSEINALLGDMQFARSEAIKEGQAVVICPVNAAGTDCGGATWAAGWIVFPDPNGVGSPVSVQSILRFQKALSSMNSAGDTLTSTATTVSFNRDGFASGLAASPTMFVLHNSPSVAAFSRCLALNPTGYLAVVASGVTVGATLCT